MDHLLYIKKDRVRLSPEQKVIKAGEYVSFLGACDILEKAREQAHRIEQEAKAAYEEEKKKGYDAGLREGRKNISRQMMDAVTNSVAYLSTVEGKVTEIVITALRKIIGDMDDKTLVLKVVRNALNVVRNQKQVTLRVSPDQVNHVRESLNSILADFPAISFIDVTGDGRVKGGGCILETEIGVVDAGVEVQLEAIQDSLEKKFQKNT
jgi:type III secretion protein L